ncbi:MAG: hypothetical protein ACRDSE_00455 [Pseudonocardiaceae bacterium]
MNWTRPVGGVARGTGAAMASDQSVANSGVMINSPVTINGAPVARSVYCQQTVSRIAPREFVGRERELAELAHFCTSPGGGGYVWWRAGPWVGKSALMSWFALHPPARIRLVSFFVTSRWADQSDRVAFTDAVMEQLAELLGESMPVYLTDSTRDRCFWDLLDRAAHAVSDHGERLILLVDGIDEDTGVPAGKAPHSIATLLPIDPPAGMRIIVAGRSNPPISGDVPERHPLRNAAVARPLGPSPVAAVVRHAMEQELKRLLWGGRVERDLLGLVTAAGGGLSAPNLAELTEVWESEIAEHLTTVAGRSFTPRPSRWQPETGAEVYVMGHEELQQMAADHLGSSKLEAYRQRLHTWADGYRARGWPADTPEYLLRGYYKLLHATDDLPRMIACATDTGRHDRMLDITGGDAAAYAEILTAQDAILARAEPDLLAMARSAIHLSELTARNVGIPDQLPVAWALLGQRQRAEALAESAHLRAHALAALAEVVAVDDPARAVALAENAASFLGAKTWSLPSTWAAVVRAVAIAGDADRAADMARSGTDPYEQAKALAAVAQVLADAGDLDHAETLADSIRHPRIRIHALADIVTALAEHHGDRAWALAERAAEAAHAITDSDEREHALADLAQAMARAGDPNRAEDIARHITSSYILRRVFPTQVRVIAETGDFARAYAMIEVWRDNDQQARALTTLVSVAVEAGDYPRALTLAREAEAAAGSASQLTDLVTAVAAAGDHHWAVLLADRAATMARSLTSNDIPATSEDVQAFALTELAETLARAGHPDRAEAIALSIPGPFGRPTALARLACIAARAGDPDRARTLALRVERSVRARADARRAHNELGALAKAVAATADSNRAESIARLISAPMDRAGALMGVVQALAHTGQFGQARVVAGQLADLAGTITDEAEQPGALRCAVRAMAYAGDLDCAEDLLGSLSAGYDRTEAQIALMDVAADVGDMVRVARLADQITGRRRRAQVLRELVTAASRVGDRGRVADIADQVAALVDTVKPYDGGINSNEIRFLVTAVARAGEPDRAAAIAQSMKDQFARDLTLAALVGVAADADDTPRAEALAGLVTDRQSRVAALAHLARAVAVDGDRDRVQALVDRAQAELGAIERPSMLPPLPALATALARAGHWGRAEALAQAITSPDQRAQALSVLAREADDPAAARRYVAWAFRTSEWTHALDALAGVCPDAVAALADEYLHSAARMD